MLWHSVILSGIRSLINCGRFFCYSFCVTVRPLDVETLPKISLVTPVFNAAKYIEQTLESVLAQNYPKLEYYVVDGASTDGTVEIIRKYEKRMTGWVSEPDQGMYDALNKGFARTSGEVMGWISATDLLRPGGLEAVGSVFAEFPEVEWITGRRTCLNEEGEVKRVDPLMTWTRYSFLLGVPLRHIQQESTYWRRSLWERAGGRVDAGRRSAGDFELWMRFFRSAELYTVDAEIGGFREHAGSDSLEDLDKFNEQCKQIAEGELRERLGGVYGAYKRLDGAVGRVPKVRAAWYFGKAMAVKGLWSMPRRVIERKDGAWKMRRARGRA